MSITVDPFTLPNPNPNPSSTALLSRRASTALFSSPASLRFEPLLRRPPSRTSMAARPLYPRGLGLFPLLHRRGSGDRLIFAFSASHEESKSSDIEVEEVKNDLKSGAEESQEAWKQALASFKEQSLKMKSVSQEAYELYSKKAMVILKETSEQLKIQAEKARYDLSVIAKEISEESKEYLSTVAESSPGPVKDIVETFASSTDDIKEISEVRDFYLGIPYGILLSFGGFLSFMLTGSVSAIRFGVILGGTLLALSISSLRSWKKGESFHLALKGQAAITSILFVREISLLYRRPSFVNCFTSLISGAVVVFYLYRITLEGGQANASSLEHGTEN